MHVHVFEVESPNGSNELMGQCACGAVRSFEAFGEENRAFNGTPSPLSTCERCGERFRKRAPQHKWCDHCSDTLHNSRRQKREAERATCAKCGREFDRYNPRKEYCSTSCRVAHWQKRQRHEVAHGR